MQTQILYLSGKIPGRVSSKCVTQAPAVGCSHTSLFLTFFSGLRTCPPPRAGSFPTRVRLGSFLPQAFAYILSSTWDTILLLPPLEECLPATCPGLMSQIPSNLRQETPKTASHLEFPVQEPEPHNWMACLSLSF